jgi:streptogramin lyase
MTSPDFQTQLRVQLRDAARREERRGGLAPVRHWLPGLSPALAVAAVALLVLAVVLIGLALRSPNPSREAAPKAVGHFRVADSLGPMQLAFGSVWAVDPSGQLLRLDPATHEVLNSFDVPAGTNVGADGTTLWVDDDANLIRIDPKTGRQLASIPLRTPAGDQFIAYDAALAGPYAWLIGIDGLLRIDLRRNVVDRFIALDTAGLSRGGFTQGDTLWLLARNDRLLRFDARTGARRSSIPVTWPASAIMDAEHGVAVTWSRQTGRIARVDVTSGRELWAQELRGTLGAWMVSGRDVWAHVSPTTGRGKDQLVRLDAGTGHVLARTVLPDFGVTGMTMASPHEVWLGTPGGQIDVVKVAPR